MHVASLTIPSSSFLSTFISMTGSADLNTADFYDYDLPESSIAQEPLADRAAARLLVLDRATQSIRI